MPAPGPTSISQIPTQGAAITVYPSDLFTPFTQVQGGVPSVQVNTGGADFGGTNNLGGTQDPGLISSSASQGFYTQIQMVPANTILTGLTGGIASAVGPTGAANPQTGSGVYLPLPWKINDIEAHLWNDLSAIDQIPVLNEVAKIAGSAERLAGSTQSVNPFLYMLYKQPAFREFELAWSFSPNNAKETQTLSYIINYLKTGALPLYNGLAGTGVGGGTAGGLPALDYPYLALIRLNPTQYMFDMKPAAITSVNIDYSGSGHGPSFYNDGGPAIVNFTLVVKEVSIQTRQDTAWRSPTLTAGMT